MSKVLESLTEFEKNYGNLLKTNFEYSRASFLDIVDLFGKEMDGEINHRYMSWKFCYEVFQKMYEKKNMEELSDADYDFLALHLGFYLASWGMYRGSSFLLSKSYKIHIPIVKYLINNCGPNTIYESDYLENLKKAFRELYNQNAKEEDFDCNKDVNSANSDEEPLNLTSTLFTKILLGTIGCVPAYDRYCKSGLSVLCMAQDLNGFDDLKRHCVFELSKQVVEENSRYSAYPPMKILDMFLFELGMIYESIKGINTLIQTDWVDNTTEISAKFRVVAKSFAHLNSIELKPENIFLKCCIDKVSNNNEVRAYLTDALSRICLNNEEIKDSMSRLLGQETSECALDVLIHKCIKVRQTKKNNANISKLECLKVMKSQLLFS